MNKLYYSFLLILLTACSANVTQSTDFDTPIRQPLETLKTLIASLHPEIQQQLQYQTAKTLDTIRQPADEVIDRQQFHQQVTKLETLIQQENLQQIPKATAVLIYLAHLSNGNNQINPNWLSPEEQQQITQLCGPSLMNLQQQDFTDKILRKSCFFWVIGDLTTALNTYKNIGVLNTQTAPFDTFELRLRYNTGIALHQI